MVDGAQFGHRIIARTLHGASTGHDTGHGGPSFWQQNFLVLGDWPRLCHRLATLENRWEVAAAVQAARRTFRVFNHCFDRSTGKVTR